MKISIIIPSYGKWHLTVNRLMELKRLCSGHDLEIVLIDDCSPEPFELLDFWKENTTWDIQYHRHTKNLGFGYSMNAGTWVATGDVYVFLSNDVIIQKDFIPEMLRFVNDSTLIGHELVEFGGWNEFQVDGLPAVVPYLGGHFLACHRDVWAKIGFDVETYGKYAFEDVDLAAQCFMNNIVLVTLDKSNFRHMVGQTAKYDADRDRITRENRQKFIDKWKGVLA